MPCVPIPVPVLPAVPAGLKLTAPMPPLPSIGVQAPCCLLPPNPPLKLPLPLPALTVNPAFVAAARVLRQKIEDYLDSLDPPCPRQ